MTTLPDRPVPFFGTACFSPPGSIVSPAEAMRMSTMLGSTALRFDYPWADSELSKGIYAPPALADGYMTGASAAGMLAIPTLGSGNRQYTEDWDKPPTDPASCAAFARWAAWLVGHYTGKGIVLPEAFNEPNNPDFWYGKPDPQQFAALLSDLLGTNIPLIGPGGGGCNGPWGDFGVYMAAVLRAVDPAQVGKLLAHTLHPYPGQSAGKWQTPEIMLDAIATYRAKTGWAGPLAVTETGHASAWVQDETTRAIYTARWMLCAILAGLKVCTLFNLVDFPGWGFDGTFGLFNADHTPKPSAIAFRSVMDALAGCVSCAGKQISPTVYEVTIQRAASKTVIAWTTSGSATDYRTTMLPNKPVRDVLGKRQWLAFNDDGTTEVTLPASGMPLMITG